MSEPSRPPVVVMGVSGCGKSTIAARLAASTGRPYFDADDLHPAMNVARMSAGIPLTDDDRWPWLDLVGRRAAESDGSVVACSALKRSYRDRLRVTAPDTVFIHLSGAQALLRRRMTTREGHFMPQSLLSSQLDTLEPLEDDELGSAVDIIDPIDAIVARARVVVLRFSDQTV